MFGDASAGVTETGIIKMFKMAQGNTVHLHCVVKLCLGGSAADCDPVSIFSQGFSDSLKLFGFIMATWFNFFQVTCGSSRRKRSALEMNRPIRAADVDRVMEVTVHSALLLASEGKFSKIIILHCSYSVGTRGIGRLFHRSRWRCQFGRAMKLDTVPRRQTLTGIATAHSVCWVG